MANQQRGFTLVKVMMLSTMASVVVFATFKDTLVQERLSGNFQKNINARLAAERGVFESMRAIESTLLNNQNMTLQQLVAAHGSSSGAKNDIQFTTTVTADGDNNLTIESLGQKHGPDANARVVGLFKYVPSDKESVFQEAVTSCKGVNLSGSGVVDSYDSSKGSYDDTKDEEGDVSTVSGDSDVRLKGESPIKGDVKASGVIYLEGSSPIYGDIHSNTGVDISYGGGVRVHGNVYSRGFYKHKGGIVKGHVRAMGDVDMKWGSEIHNEDIARETPTDPANLPDDPRAIIYVDKGKFEDTGKHAQNGLHYSDGSFKEADLDLETIKVNDLSTEEGRQACDPLQLPLYMPDIISSVNTFQDFLVTSTQTYQFSPRLGSFITNGSGYKQSKEHDIYLFDYVEQNHGDTDVATELAFEAKNFTIASDGEVYIKGGDVILFVDGDFTMTGDARLHIENGSTLTVFVTGKVNLGGSAAVIAEQEGITVDPVTKEERLPTLSFYSSYDKKEGFIFSGATSLYAAIYAPDTTVLLNGSGQFYGSIRGASVEATGATGVHFDKAMKTVKVLAKGTQVTGGHFEFAGWQYRVAEDSSEEEKTK